LRRNIMKKIIIMTVVLLFVSGSAGAANIILEFKAQYFSPSDEAFQDIYGGGVMYGGEVSIGVWKGLELWFGGSYFSREGELTFTKEKSELKIIPVGGGVRYRWQGNRLSPYLAAGLGNYQFKESNPIGEVDEGRMGYSAAIGTYVKVTGGLLIDLYANYSVCEMRPGDFEIDYEINIGGFGAGIGIAFEF
jgi:opacity protein-like surface antigen